MITFTVELEAELLCCSPVAQHFDAYWQLVAPGFQRREGHMQESGCLRLESALTWLNLQDFVIEVVSNLLAYLGVIDAPVCLVSTIVGQLHHLPRSTTYMDRDWLQLHHGGADRETSNVGCNAVRFQVEKHGMAINDIEHHREHVCADAVVVILHLHIQEIAWEDLTHSGLNLEQFVLLHPREVCFTLVHHGLLIAPIWRVLQVQILWCLEGEAHLQSAWVQEHNINNSWVRSCSRRSKQKLEWLELANPLFLLVYASGCLKPSLGWSNFPIKQRIDPVNLELVPHHRLRLQCRRLCAQINDSNGRALHVSADRQHGGSLSSGAGCIIRIITKGTYQDLVLVNPPSWRPECERQGICAPSSDTTCSVIQLKSSFSHSLWHAATAALNKLSVHREVHRNVAGVHNCDALANFIASADCRKLQILRLH
mmetsp:Transcript_73454/g.175053  ORF Transcript_73454/g.175053 Transcript_73454/m.175053 type:complete len:426 (+) Transcript_73454:1924-3201(+)